jgi:hypothetical protein
MAGDPLYQPGDDTTRFSVYLALCSELLAQDGD